MKIDKNSQFGIKFFSEKEHKEMFDKGHLFSNPISYYRNNAKELGTGRGDGNEGILEHRLFDNNGVTFQTKTGKKFSGNITSITRKYFEYQHIFSFMLLEKEWLTFTEKNFSFKLPVEISKYFMENYGEYFSVFSVDVLLESLKNITLENGCLGYVSHFKVDYVDELYITSSDRFTKISNKIDQVIEMEDDFENGYPILLDIYKEYMGVKSNEYAKENEIRVVLGDDSRSSSIITMTNFKAK